MNVPQWSRRSKDLNSCNKKFDTDIMGEYTTSSQMGVNLFTIMIFLKFKDRQAWVYSEVPDQTPPLEV